MENYDWLEVDYDDLKKTLYNSEHHGVESSQIACLNWEVPSRRGFIFRQKQLDWWGISENNLQWVVRIVTPNYSGGHMDILLENAIDGKVNCNIVCVMINNAYPKEIFDIFAVGKIGWDVRESRMYPKQQELN